MPSTRPIKLDDWGISWEEYKELTYFCLQYNAKKRDAAALLTIKTSTPPPAIYHKNGKEYGTFLPHGSGHVSDPVAATAEKRDRLLRDVRMIEAAASVAAGELAPYILRAVTTRDGTRKTRAAMQTPIGERQFYALRRKFYWVLREMKNGALDEDRVARQ